MNAIFISVRTGSTRLPQKAIKKIKNKTTIEHLIDRLKQSKNAKKIILCTTTKKEDDILCKIAENNNIDYFRGSEEDKLLRWYDASKYFNIKYFVNVDGDDIFFDHGLADLVLEQIENTKCDFVDGHGLYNDVYGITYNGLEAVIKNKTSKKTEFIKPFFEDISNKIKIEKIKNVPEKYKKTKIRFTLDYKEDFLFFKEIIDYFIENKIPMTFEAILSYIKDNPSITKINFFREEDWSSNQKKMFNI